MAILVATRCSRQTVSDVATTNRRTRNRIVIATHPRRDNPLSTRFGLPFWVA